MKIIQLLQKPQLRGAEIFACQLSGHLAEMGHDVMVVTIFKGDAELPFRGRMVHLERPISKRLFDPTGWKDFGRLVQEFDPDIIQANASDTLKFAVSSKTLLGWKIPVVFRNANKMGDFITSRAKWHLNRFYISRIDRVISVSKECEKDFRKIFDYPEDKIETIEIGVEDKPVGGIPEDLEPVFSRGPTLAHIGGFVPEKNHEGLLEIFSKTLDEFPDVQLLLIGKGRLQPEMRKRVKELGVEENVHFLDYRKDVLEILTHSRGFVLPSLIEGLPGVILEAMYCETPVVAYDVGGIREIVISGKTGWLVSRDDQEGFRSSLREVLAGGSGVDKTVTEAKVMISNRFMNEKIAARFLDSYSKLLGAN